MPTLGPTCHDDRFSKTLSGKSVVSDAAMPSRRVGRRTRFAREEYDLVWIEQTDAEAAYIKATVEFYKYSRAFPWTPVDSTEESSWRFVRDSFEILSRGHDNHELRVRVLRLHGTGVTSGMYTLEYGHYFNESGFIDFSTPSNPQQPLKGMDRVPRGGGITKYGPELLVDSWLRGLTLRIRPTSVSVGGDINIFVYAGDQVSTPSLTVTKNIAASDTSAISIQSAVIAVGATQINAGDIITVYVKGDGTFTGTLQDANCVVWLSEKN